MDNPQPSCACSGGPAALVRKLGTLACVAVVGLFIWQQTRPKPAATPPEAPAAVTPPPVAVASTPAPAPGQAPDTAQPVPAPAAPVLPPAPVPPIAPPAPEQPPSASDLKPISRASLGDVLVVDLQSLGDFEYRQRLSKPGHEAAAPDGTSAAGGLFGDDTTAANPPPAGTPKPSAPAIDPDLNPATDRPVIPAKIKALNGKRVGIQGFMVPMDLEAGKSTEFLLAPVIPGCFFCQPPRINEFIVVKMKDGKGAAFSNGEPVVVTGKLTVGEEREGDMVTSIYRIEADKVIEGTLADAPAGQF